LLACNGDGRLWTTQGHRLRIWAVPPWREVGTWDNGLANVLSGKGGLTSLSLGAKWALLGARDGRVHILDRRRLEEKRALSGDAEVVSRLATHAAEPLVAAASA